MLRPDAVLIGTLGTLSNPKLAERLAERGITAISMDAIPRITRAQSMDSLSSQSTVGGYKAVLMAANRLPKFFPLLTTAAGTVRPARGLIMGAGVAGLMAIGTARRLGAVVEAFDVRPVVKEQVESLGATFVEVPMTDEEKASAQTSGGYAREMSEDYLRRQRELIAERVQAADFVITTALIPGRPAPKLITAEMVRTMQPGSVIVDMAAEAGGNCELTEPGREAVVDGVTIIGLTNLPATVPTHASQMYAKNVQTLVDHLVHEGKLTLDLEDEITKGATITHGGKIVHEATAAALAAAVGRARSHDRGSRPPGARRRPVHPRPGRVRRLRDREQGPDHAPHPAHVRGQRGPWRDRGGGDHRDRHRRVAAPAGPGPGRGHPGHDQRGRRLRRHRPDARDVPRPPGRGPASHDRGDEHPRPGHLRGLPRRVGQLHPGPEVPRLAEDGAHRQPARCRRHGAGRRLDDRHRAGPVRQLVGAGRRRADRNRHRRGRRPPGADDRHAPDGRHLQRRRRWGRRRGRGLGVPDRDERRRRASCCRSSR